MWFRLRHDLTQRDPPREAPEQWGDYDIVYRQMFYEIISKVFFGTYLENFDSPPALFLWSLTSGMHPRISLSLLRIMQVEIISSGMCWFCPAGVIGIYIFKSFLSLLTQRVWKKRYASFVWAIDLKRNPQLVFTFILERKNPPPLPPSAFGTKTYLYK